MNDSAKIITAFAAGTVTGLILGVLFAPDKGCETRNKIARSSKKFSEDLGKEFKNGREKLTGLTDDLKEKVETAADRVGEYL